ncbi:cAMP phosphodiesterase [Pelomyxa schiedti]|nr:cAMP phosphodiesterase [Pelomyxa schiedti]
MRGRGWVMKLVGPPQVVIMGLVCLVHGLTYENSGTLSQLLAEVEKNATYVSNALVNIHQLMRVLGNSMDNTLSTSSLSDTELLNLFYCTQEEATARGHPAKYGYLSDENPNRTTEFVAWQGMLPVVEKLNVTSCRCFDLWEEFCQKYFNGQGECVDCPQYCAAIDAYVMSHLLDEIGTTLLSTVTRASGWILSGGSEYGLACWLRALGWQNLENHTIAETIPQDCSLIPLADPIHNLNHTIQYLGPASFLTQALYKVSLSYPVYMHDTYIGGVFVQLSLNASTLLLEEFLPCPNSFAIALDSSKIILTGTTLTNSVFSQVENCTLYCQLPTSVADINFTVTGYDVRPIGKEKYLLVHSAIRATPWSLVVFIPYSYVLKSDPTVAIMSSVAGGILFIVSITLILMCLMLLRFRAKVHALEHQVGINVLDTPAEFAIQTLSEIKSARRLTSRMRKELNEVIGLIASNKLYKADYISKKQMGLLNVDSEVDDYIKTTLLRYNTDENEQIQQGVPLNSNTNSIKIVIEDSGDSHSLNSWNFNVLEFPQAPKVVFHRIFMKLVDFYCLVDKLSLNRQKLENYIMQIADGYFDNPYHCALHAIDVCQAVHMCLRGLGEIKISDKEIFASILASAIHDYRHPGVNNNYLHTTLDGLAIRYNGISILENMHAAVSFELLFMDENNFLEKWERKEIVEFHQLVTSLVLATDMSRHVELLSSFKTKFLTKGIDWEKKSERDAVLQMFIKFADVNNATRPWEIAKLWAERIMEEFFRQGDEEKKGKLPVSPFMDRTDSKIPKCQATFIEYVIQPFADVIGQVLPSLRSELQENVATNLAKWRALALAASGQD